MTFRQRRFLEPYQADRRPIALYPAPLERGEGKGLGNQPQAAKRLLKKREGEITQGKLPGLYFDRVRSDELAQDYFSLSLTPSTITVYSPLISPSSTQDNTLLTDALFTSSKTFVISLARAISLSPKIS